MDGEHGNPFDTDDAFTDGYDNLEQRCFQEEIDYDESTHTSIRIRGWQEVAINTVKNHSGTNQTQVLYSTYNEGISRLRDVVERERIKELSEMAQEIINVFLEYDNLGYEHNDLYSDLIGDKIQDPLTHHGDVEEHKSAYFKDSAKSEIKDTFEVDANFGGWIHRAVVSIGLGASDTIPKMVMERVEEVEQAISNVYDEAREGAERSTRTIIAENHEYWVENGIYQGQLESLEELVSMMVTGHKGVAEITLESVRENAEILEG